LVVFERPRVSTRTVRRRKPRVNCLRASGGCGSAATSSAGAPTELRCDYCAHESAAARVNARSCWHRFDVRSAGREL